MSGEIKKGLQTLSAALRELHRELLMLEAKALDSEAGRPLSPYDLLHASLHDLRLAWLRQISALIVSIDTTIDEAAHLTATEANHVASTVLKLLEKPSAGNDEFWTKYTNYLSHDANVIMRHSKVKDIAARLHPKM
jgi:hypothetical protein